MNVFLVGAILAAWIVAGMSRAHAQPTPEILSRQACFGGVDSYDAWMIKLRDKNSLLGYVAIRLKFPRSEFDHYRARLDCDSIEYRSDQHIVRGWVVQPKKRGKDKLPVIVFNRGGNRNLGAVTFARLFDSVFPLAEQGFIVVVSQYRGVSSQQDLKPSPDEYGGAEVRDVTNLMKLLPTMPRADTDNVFMIGESRGAIMTFRALLDAPVPVRAVAVHGGAYDLHDLVRFRPVFEGMFKVLIPGYARNRSTELDRRSVTRWAGRLPPRTGVLMLHGGDDERTPVTSAHKLARELKRLGRPHRLIIYPGETHAMRGERDTIREETVRWFRRFQVDVRAPRSRSTVSAR